MSTSADLPRPLAARVLLVGAGGVGAPCALALIEAGVVDLTIVDDDRVEAGNLHRQILFDAADVGASKLEATRAALARRSASARITLRHGRALPSSALALARGADVIIDATDNFASRFLLADAAQIAGVPIVHAAAVRWTGTVLAVAGGGAPCYRCLFEDLPEGPAPDCATAGVVGPVCGVVGAIAAEMAVAFARREERLARRIATYDGLADELRLVDVAARASCALCGPSRTILDLDEARYLAPSCAA